MSGDDRPTLPAVQLPAEAELARQALAAPLLSRAARLARWASAPVPVGAGGELPDDRLKEAVEHLGLASSQDGIAETAEAWCFAVDCGLVTVDESGAGPEQEAEGIAGTAVAGAELAALTGGPDEVLEVWAAGLDAVLADAATPSLESLLGGLDGAVDERGEIDPNAIDLDALEWNPEEEGEFLDSALAGLYLLTLTDEAAASGAMVPLPVVAASMVVPEEMEEPSDEVLEEVSAVMMRLDEQFRILAPTGLLEYDPVDEALVAEAEEEEGPLEAGEDEDLTRYGQVRLTPLGLYGVRQRMLGAGVDAPAVGDLAGAPADELLAAVAVRSEPTARAEAELWLARRETADAARALLEAARGTDAAAPGRRLGAQLVLSLAGIAAEPALRDVLDDRELGGLARVWLTERRLPEVPPPSEEMVFWLTIDTLAAQLDALGPEDEESVTGLRELVSGLVEQHTGFFAKAWRVDHPATAVVLEAMGRLHPDKTTAQEARRAAYKSRSHQGAAG